MKSASSLVAGRMFTWLAYLGARWHFVVRAAERLGRRQVVRGARRDDLRLEEEDPSEDQRRLVVQQGLPPVLGHELRKDDGHDGVATARSAPDLLQQRRTEIAEGRLDQDERNVHPPLVPG